MEKMIKLGPTDMKGSLWDECGKTKIEQILISHSERFIHSIQFVYVVDGKVLRSEMHRELRACKFDIVTVDHPGEYLTSISGHYSDNRNVLDHHGQLLSIAFGTNIREYGPFGSVLKRSISQFVYNFTPKSSFWGFYGSVWFRAVYAIGVYIKPIESLAEIKTYMAGIKIENDQSTCNNTLEQK